MVAPLGMLGFSAANGLLKAIQHNKNSEKTHQSAGLEKLAGASGDGQNLPAISGNPTDFTAQDTSARPPLPPAADAATMASILKAQEQAGARLFQQLDTDGVKGISKEELTAALSKLDGSDKKTDGADGEAKGLADKLMAKLDVNKDGSISEEELTTALSKLDASDKKTEATEAASRSQSFVDKLMAQLDADKDGSISKDELTEALRSRHGKGDKHVPPAGEEPAGATTGEATASASIGTTQPVDAVSLADLKNGIHAYGRAPSDVLMSLLKSADTGVAA